MKALAYAWFFIISTHVLGRGAVDYEHDDRVSMEPIQQDLAAPLCWIRAVIIAASVRVLGPHPMVSHCVWRRPLRGRALRSITLPALQ
ncbi:hypothetical protein [Alcanivorax sp.]|uniref:hypothetical protein n=1 Tax=Alcanivorax sp. TaxID=1872427 RepID=UPI0032D91477